MVSLTQWTRVWANSGKGQVSLVYCSPQHHKESDRTERLNNNSPVDQSSKILAAQWLREEAGPCSDRKWEMSFSITVLIVSGKWEITYFSFLKSRDLPDYTCTQRFLGVKRVMLPWLIDACSHIRGSWDIPYMDPESSKSNWLVKGNPEE